MYLTVSGKTRLKIDQAMGQTIINNSNLFWLRCRIDEAGYEIPPKVAFIILNTVSSIQRSDLKEYRFSSNYLPDFFIDLKNVPILDNTLTIKVNTEVWSEVEDFDASKPSDNHYTVDLANAVVNFGNGINGKIPPKGTDNITVSYRTGGGIDGNVKPHFIKKVIGELADKVTVDNHNAASGGEEGETLEAAIYRARINLKTVTRAVTSLDYEYLTLNTPALKVARAKAIPGYHPSQTNKVPGIVTIIVVPQSPYPKPMPGRGFIKTVYRHLEKHRLLATELFVIQPSYTEVFVEAAVVIKPKYLKETIEKNVKSELEKFLHPITGGIDAKGWPFGRPVYISEIYEVIDRVEGVDYVKDVTLNGKSGDVLIHEHALVYSGDHTIKA
jgi:predicted phage baseplate assembly protein